MMKVQMRGPIDGSAPGRDGIVHPRVGGLQDLFNVGGIVVASQHQWPCVIKHEFIEFLSALPRQYLTG